MLKRSAGILPYKIIDNKIYVFLAHPGGPLNNNDDWSVCKGEYQKNEKAINAAIREFKEETSYKIDKEELTYLYTTKVNPRKLATIFILNKDLDTNIKSNSFTLKDHKKYPEMDKANWFEIDDAYNYIFKGQIKFLDKLKEYINESNNNI